MNMYYHIFVVLIPHMCRFINCSLMEAIIVADTLVYAYMHTHVLFRSGNSTLDYLVQNCKSLLTPVCLSRQLLQKILIGNVNQCTTHASDTSNMSCHQGSRASECNEATSYLAVVNSSTSCMLYRRKGERLYHRQQRTGHALADGKREDGK